MKSSLSLACLFLLATIHCSAQFIRGYVITHENDSLPGFIEDKRNNRKSIVFKPNLNAATQVLSSSEVNRFYIEEYDELYISKIVSIDQKPIETRYLEDNPTPKFSTDTVFLKQLVRGTMSLLSYADATNRNHFYFSKDGKTEELILLRYLLINQIIEREDYKQQLINHTTDCNSVNAKSLTFNEAALIRFFKKYNECISPIKYTTSKKKSISLGLGVVAGAAYIDATYSGDEEIPIGIPLNYDEPSNRFLPSFGLTLDISSFKKNNPLVLTIETLWRSCNFTWVNNKQDPWFYSPYKEATMKMSWLNIALRAKYKFNHQHEFRPYLAAGINFIQMLKNDTKLVTSTEIPSETKTYTPFMEIRSLNYGINASLGAEYKKLFLEVRFDQSLFPAKEERRNILLITPGIYMGYRFQKKVN